MEMPIANVRGYRRPRYANFNGPLIANCDFFLNCGFLMPIFFIHFLY